MNSRKILLRNKLSDIPRRIFGRSQRPRPLMQELARYIEDHRTYGVISYRALATQVGTSPRSVARWIAGVDNPDPRMAAALRRWMRQTMKGAR